MKKNILSIAVLVAVCNSTIAQSVGIGTTAPDASSVLELKATNKGFLPPRMTAAQKGLIPSPKAGLLVYQTDGVAGLYVCDGAAWMAVASTGSTAGGWSLTGNSGTNPAANFIGTTDNQPLKFRVNNITSGGIYPGLGNVGIGMYSLDSITSGNSNNAVGYNALHNVKTGYENSAFGVGALYSNVSGNSNVAIGASTLAESVAGNYNTGVGPYALTHNATGNKNTALGYNALFQNKTGDNNIAIGTSAAFLNDVGNNNIAIGTSASNNNKDGNNIIAIGDSALLKNNMSYNMAIGSRALRSNTTGVSNTAIGADVLYNNITGNQNTAVGRTSLYGNISGIQNTAVDVGTLRYNGGGDGNTAVGFQSLLFNVDNSNNTALGHIALASTTADNNTGIGKSALTNNTVGTSNTAIGVEALGTNTIGNYNTAIGYRANTWGTNFTNATAIGANSQAGCSDCVVLGSINGYNGASVSAKIGIGAPSPQKTLHVNPNGAGGMMIGHNMTTGGYTVMDMGISQASGGYSYIQSIKSAGSSYGNLVLNQSGGFVGIKTGNPIAALHLKQYVDDPSAIDAGLRLERHDNTSHWDMAVDVGSNLSFSYNGVEKFWVDELDGDITTVSDLRMKKDIQPIETALPSIMKLRAKSYHYQDNAPGSRLSYGFIAQDVEKIFPDFVSTKGPDDSKAVGYQKIGVMATRAIQEQQVIIEGQQKEIDLLKQQNNGMLEAIQKLQKAVDKIKQAK